MKFSLRTLLFSLASVAIIVITLGHLAFNLKDRIDAAGFRLAAQTQRLTAVGAPLLLNSLVVGDLASAEQVLRNLNLDLVWNQVRLYESDGKKLILDASPASPPRSDAPRWLKRLLPLNLKESRIPIVADPVVYAVLAVTPSSESLESELWRETRTTVMATAVLLTTSLVVMTLIVGYGLRPVRALGESAARFGSGDLSARMPETSLAEVAPTVRAFNAMASNLEQVLTELRAKEGANRRLAAIVEQSEEAILTIDREHRTTSWNAGARQLFGYTSEEMLGQSIGRLFVAATDAHLEEQIRHLSETRPPSRVETALVRSSGPPVMVAASASPLSGEDGAHIGHIIVARDMTERQRADSELRWAKEQAEAGNRAKAEFLATMSHEIRTPMNGIIGMTDLMLDTDMTAEQREYVNLVKVSANALLQVINEILDFSKVEAGRIELEAIDFSLRTTLGHTLKPLALQAHQKGLELALAVHPDVPDGLIGDPGRLRQLLVNLVGNALKFTEHGEVVVRAETALEGGGEVQLHFAVSDTGVGIPVPKLPMIFGAFTQADSSTTRRYGGTGLGLAITKRLVEQMGGRVWAESEEGRGSTFHFAIRFGLSEGRSTPPVPAQPVQLRDLAVLVVDDNGTSRRILVDMLSRWGMRPTTVEGAEAALAAMEGARLAGAPFRVVITDSQMPGMDGFALAERITGSPAFVGTTILMLSSSGQRGDAARCREVGVAAYLMKPVTQSELLDALLTALGTPGVAGERAPLVTRHSLREGRRRLRVLLAEDNPVNQRLAVRLLERQGHMVVVAGDGRAALETLARELFDLVLMDVQMPEIDGFEATALIRRREAEPPGPPTSPEASSSGAVAAGRRRIPIVALTAHAMKGDEERCLAAGMDAYLAKPVKAEELVAVINRLLPEVALTTPATAPPVDLAITLLAVDGDRGLLAELVGAFVGDSPGRVAELREALRAGDGGRLERAAHALKGAVATFGAGAAQGLAGRLETLGREGRLETAPALLAALERELARMTAFFSESGCIGEAPYSLRPS